MKRLLILTACILLMPPFLGQAAAPQTAKPASPLEALGAYLGRWNGTGKLLDTPYSKAASIGGITDCNWGPNHGFLICDQKNYGPGGPSNDLSVYTYNEQTQTYEFFGLSRDSTEVRTPKLTVRRGWWTYSSEFTDHGGKRVMTRTVNEWMSPTTINFKVEYSLDGAHWTLMGSGSEQRVK